MNRILTAVFIVLLTSLTATAQRGRPTERIHAAKMAYITDRLNLTTQQSANFIPLYNDFEKEKRDIRMFFFRKYMGANLSGTNDETSRQIIDDNLDYQQRVIELKRKYNEEFLKVISAQQLADLYKAEREFKEMLIKRLDRPHRGPGRYRR